MRTLFIFYQLFEASKFSIDKKSLKPHLRDLSSETRVNILPDLPSSDPLSSFLTVSAGPACPNCQQGAEMSPHLHRGQCGHVQVRPELSPPLREAGGQPGGGEAEAGQADDSV